MTYEYACEACGHTWEAEQSINDAALTECPNCKKDTAKRMISGGQGFILKGGGWYADGYGSAKPDAKKPDAKTPSETTGTTPAKTPEKKSSESKPAAPAKASESAKKSSGGSGDKA